MSDIDESGAEELRALARWLDNTAEHALDNLTAEELLTLFRAYRASDWDFTLDYWDPKQVSAALRGVVPRWDPETERPILDSDES